ncbi:MAG: SRPBCC family protein [Polyangiaceae bacterium]|nr:SRPBCC family protein [Polyangiaceae bacterium]
MFLFRRSTYVAVAALAALLGCAALGSAQSDDGLSERDRGRLARGELIVRETSQRRGPLTLIGGTSFQVINASPDLVWRALHDAARFGEMLPGATRSQQTFRRGNDRGLAVQHGTGALSASYELKLNYVEPTRVVMFQVDDQNPGALRAGWGFLKVRPWAGGDKTLVTFGILADVGDGMLAGALRPRVHEWMLRVPQTMKRFLERHGNAIYARGN